MKPDLSREPARSAKWPERLIELAQRWRRPAEIGEREKLREELWVLTVGALELKIRHCGVSHPALDAEARHDLAVQKGLDLIARFDRKEWDPAATAAAQLQRFFTVIARNSVVDHLRTHGRREMLTLSLETSLPQIPATVPPDEFRVDRARLARALMECANGLTPRARRIWFYRTCYEMTSRQIAEHPQVRMKPPAVDMVLSRAREKLRACLRSRGFDRRDFRTGVFALVWESFASQQEARESEAGDGKS